MTKIKICGLKRLEDIDMANSLVPDYIGFVFAKSARQIEPEAAKQLSLRLDPKIKRVGVFVDMPIDRLIQIQKDLCLDVLQLHGHEDKSYCDSVSFPLWKAIRIANGQSFEGYQGYEVEGFVLDSFKEGIYGGTGESFDWGIDCSSLRTKQLILAGGLTPTNVLNAIKSVGPDVVDVSSGVEIDGLKNYHLMEQFVRRVRSI